MKILLISTLLIGISVSLEYHNFDFLELPGAAKANEKFNQAMGGGKPNGRFGDAGFGGMSFKNNKQNSGTIPLNEFEKMQTKMNGLQSLLLPNSGNTNLNNNQRDQVTSQNKFPPQPSQPKEGQFQRSIPQNNKPSQTMPLPKKEDNHKTETAKNLNKNIQTPLNLSKNAQRSQPNQFNNQQNSLNINQNNKINNLNQSNLRNQISSQQPNPYNRNAFNQNYKQREQPLPSNNFQRAGMNRGFPNMNRFNNQFESPAPYRANPDRFNPPTVSTNNIPSRINNLRLRGNNPEELKKSFLNQFENMEDGPISADSETLFELSQLN